MWTEWRRCFMLSDTVWETIKQGPDANTAQWMDAVAEALVDLHEGLEEVTYDFRRHRTGV